MQIGPVVPAQNLNHFLIRRASFKSRLSPLNPLTRPTSNTLNAHLLRSTDQTRQHLSNLDELLPEKELHPRPSQTDPILPESVNGLKENRGKGILEKLNLTRIWEMKTDNDDIMSPGHFSRFQRLLSKCSEYSPRNNLSLRWRLYHGCDNWVGLLDPLDENLRREVVRYGEFVQAAYQGFCSISAVSADRALPPWHVALSDKSYKVTKSLYATSSVGLPSWINDVAVINTWLTERSSRIGYVAICDDNMEIQRMGRRDIVIALRGTITCLEWAENMRDMLVQMPNVNSQNKINEDNQNIGQPKVECGFLSLYKTRGTNVPSLAESVVKEVQRLIELYRGESLSITVTGHSLGAALALLVADELSSCAPVMPPVAVFSFGSPRVGNRRFADQVNSNGVKVLRIVNDQDVITRVPGMFVNEKLDQKLRESGDADEVLNILDNNMPWAYSHVGTELRVNMKMSPYLKPDADPACCHDLEAYLHLLDGFLASNCPFRVNAKRSLAKLLIEQRSNIKRLYTSKVNSHTLNLERIGHQPMSS